MKLFDPIPSDLWLKKIFQNLKKESAVNWLLCDGVDRKNKNKKWHAKVWILISALFINICIMYIILS